MLDLIGEVGAAVIQPTIATTASTSFTRTYTWEITKTASVSLLTLAPGESQDVYYTVQVVQIVTDSDLEVTGTIVIVNPLDSGVTLTDVSDSVSPGYAAAVQCPVSLPYGLTGGGSVTCTYCPTMRAERTQLPFSTAAPSAPAVAEAARRPM